MVSHGVRIGEMWCQLTGGGDGGVNVDNRSRGPFIGARSWWKGKMGDGSNMCMGALRQSLECPGGVRSRRSEVQWKWAPREGHVKEDFVCAALSVPR
jgi:hypothetical protein